MCFLIKMSRLGKLLECLSPSALYAMERLAKFRREECMGTILRNLWHPGRRSGITGHLYEGMN
jgi:hypothetical protein